MFTSSYVTTGKPGSIHILSIMVFSCQAPCQASFRPLLLGLKSSIQLPRWSCSKPWSGGQQGLERAWGMVTDFDMGRYKENSKQTDGRNDRNDLSRDQFRSHQISSDPLEPWDSSNSYGSYGHDGKWGPPHLGFTGIKVGSRAGNSTGGEWSAWWVGGLAMPVILLPWFQGELEAHFFVFRAIQFIATLTHTNSNPTLPERRNFLPPWSMSPGADKCGHTASTGGAGETMVPYRWHPTETHGETVRI